MTEILGMSEYRLFEGSRPKMTYWVCYIRRIEGEKSYSLNAARRKISRKPSQCKSLLVRLVRHAFKGVRKVVFTHGGYRSPVGLEFGFLFQYLRWKARSGNILGAETFGECSSRRYGTVRPICVYRRTEITQLVN